MQSAKETKHLCDVMDRQHEVIKLLGQAHMGTHRDEEVPLPSTLAELAGS
jgi:hypothetical protein